MKIVLWGKLRDQYGESFQIATDTPAEAIEGLSRQLPDWPRDLVIDCVGHGTVEKLKSPTKEKEIHLIPAMMGGGGKFGKIVLGAALIGLALVGPGLIGGVGLFFSGTSIGMSYAAIGFLGATLMISGISQLFMKQPTLDKGSNDEGSKYLGAGRNTTAIGTSITLAWGRVKLQPHFLSVQVNSTRMTSTSFPTSFS